MTDLAVVPTDDTEDAPELTAKAAKAEEARQGRADLRTNEKLIGRGEQSLTLMAEALTAIRDGRLYKYAIDPDTGKGYKAFAKYLLSHPEWGFSRQYASKLITKLRDDKLIESGQEPEIRPAKGARELTPNAAAMKIAKSFGQFADTISKYADAVDDGGAFRVAFDKMYGSVEKTVNGFVNAYPAPVEETFTTE
jgi:hypothetical protein